jgi:hypothetical protein
MKVICYTYDADHHCEECMVNMLWNRGQPYMFLSYDDVIAWSEKAKDSEGNPIHPMFDTEEWYANDIFEGNKSATLNCGDCGKELDTYEA